MTDELRKAGDGLAEQAEAVIRGALAVTLCSMVDAYRAAAKKADEDAARKADAARRRSWR